MKLKLSILFCFLCLSVYAQDSTFTSQDLSITNLIDGTLLLPEEVSKPNLAIIIAGSGPTDRNGNQNFLKNNALKKLAEALTKQGIATFRYDKRIVKQIKTNAIDKAITFDDFISDASAVLDFFKSKNMYSHIYIIGHSQGSLVGMVAAQDEADGFISIAGAGQSIDEVILNQLQTNAPIYTEDAKEVFEVLKTGETTHNFPTELKSIFNKDIQPFLSNWMLYNPQEEISKLNIPILIVNGTSDLQVSPNEANLLHEAAPKSTLKMIDKMNHVLVIIEGDNLENSKSYNESARPISPELIKSITTFIK